MMTIPIYSQMKSITEEDQKEHSMNVIYGICFMSWHLLKEIFSHSTLKLEMFVHKMFSSMKKEKSKLPIGFHGLTL